MTPLHPAPASARWKRVLGLRVAVEVDVVAAPARSRRRLCHDRADARRAARDRGHARRRSARPCPRAPRAARSHRRRPRRGRCGPCSRPARGPAALPSASRAKASRTGVRGICSASASGTSNSRSPPALAADDPAAQLDQRAHRVGPGAASGFIGSVDLGEARSLPEPKTRRLPRRNRAGGAQAARGQRRTAAMRSSAQSISSRSMTSGGEKRMVWPWVSLARMPRVAQRLDQRPRRAGVGVQLDRQHQAAAAHLAHPVARGSPRGRPEVGAELGRALDQPLLDQHPQRGARHGAGERVAAEGRAVLAGLQRRRARRCSRAPPRPGRSRRRAPCRSASRRPRCPRAPRPAACRCGRARSGSRRGSA